MPTAAKSKVKLRPIFFDKELHEHTMAYWRVARVWNGVGEPMTVMDAMTIASNIMSHVGPQRRVSACASQILEDLVQYGTPSNKRRKNKNKKDLKPANSNRIHVL